MITKAHDQEQAFEREEQIAASEHVVPEAAISPSEADEENWFDADFSR